MIGKDSLHSLCLFINGKNYRLLTTGEQAVDPRMTLLQFLREQRLTGTKLGCGEGGCGACTVMISRVISSGGIVHYSSNACLTPVCSLDGCAVTTVEGIGGMRQGLHPVQRRIAELHGSQCGFCTPGIVMAIYAQLRSKPDSSPHEIESALDGNLCRCTGYRPIIDAARSLSNNKGDIVSPQGCNREGGCLCQDRSALTEGEEKIHLSSETSLLEYRGLNEEMMAMNRTEPIFPPFLLSYKPSYLIITNETCSWYQPLTLSDLLQIKQKFPQAKMVLGNTEVGIEVKFKGMEYPHLINPVHIPELQVCEFTNEERGSGLLIGGAVSINRIRKVIESLDSDLKAEKHFLLRGYKAVAQMITWFASNHIRNVATIGGNIATASPISDMNPMLMACGALLKLVSTDGERILPIRDFFISYRRVALQPNEIIENIFIPVISHELEYILPFKQARRREDDISIVTAGLRFSLKVNGHGEEQCSETKSRSPISSQSTLFIDSCTLSFGGMAPTTICAKKTQSFLSGKAWTLGTIEESFHILKEELQLPTNVPGGQAEYRLSLTMSFVLKAYLTISNSLYHSLQTGKLAAHKHILIDPSSLEVSDLMLSGLKNFITEDKPYTRGEQIYTLRKGGMQQAHPTPHQSSVNDNRGLVGQPMIHKNAEAQVCGEAKYTGDVNLPANAVYAHPVMSQRAHAYILNVDISEAEKCAGFVAYISAKDIQGLNKIGAVVKDEEIFVTREVKHVGAIIGAVIAESHEQAVYAAKKVRVEYEDLLAVINIEQAIASNSFFPDHHALESGDLDHQISQADIHVKGTIRIGGQEHFYLETNNSTVIPVENDTYEVISSTQNCAKTQNFCASAMGIPANKVVAKCKRMGGGFGGKETRSVFIACVAAVAAQTLNRPVSITIERDIDMSITGQRHAFVIEYMAGCKRDGKLSYLRAQLYSNAGFSLDLSQPVMDRALFHCDGVYRWPALHVRGSLCRTNQPTHTAFRGFGGPQGLMVSEIAIQHLAHEVNLSPEYLRAVNIYEEGDRTHFGMRLEYFYVPKLWQKLHVVADISSRNAAVDEFNRANKYRKRGICVLPTKFGISFTAKFMNQGGALVHVYMDGSVLVAHGGTEMGQGLFTKVIQVAAQCFGIPDSMVYTAETATNTVPNASPSAASMSTDLYGMAVLDACEQILSRLRGLKEELPDADWKSLINVAYFRRIDLSAHGFYIVPSDRCGYDWSLSVADNMQQGQPFNYFTQGVACSEVEIDALTGDLSVLRTDILMDVGRSINPALDIGQIEGGFVQGMGWCTMEEMVWGDNEHLWVRTGQLFTKGPGTYKIPAFNDVPRDFRVHLADTDNRFAVHSSKAIGEPPFFLGASVFFAAKQAIAAYRQAHGRSEYFSLDSPASSERIRMACADEITSLCIRDSETFRPFGSW